MVLAISFCFLLSFLTFLFSNKKAYWFVFILLCYIWAITSYNAIQVLISGNEIEQVLISNFYFGPLLIKIDKLTALFILVINFTSISSYLYAKKYLEPYENNKGKYSFSLHYLNFLMLNIGMLLVVMIYEAYGFLLAWELMSLSSFLLVIFESDNVKTLKEGVKYLVQMHISYLFIVTAFLVVYMNTGIFGFEGLKHIVISDTFVLQIPNSFWIFLLFFVGFGTKAGFFPFHIWLPRAHPAAPSHVSGLMSGVMIKMGIYGIIRVLFNLPEMALSIGLFILFMSIITGIFGISFSIVQNDLKKLLAYSSIENIGVIGIGIGVGVLGEVFHQPIIAVLGWAGALFHLINHSQFKSLLFYSAGSVYLKTHTRDINSLGGLIKKMPFTALAFLIGAIAISGIPPFNGFISEFIIYNGLFEGLKEESLQLPLLMAMGILGLTVIGGLALFSFSRAFGMLFLGTPRTLKAEHAIEVPMSMRIAKTLPLLLIIAIGLFPIYVFNFISGIINDRFPAIEIQALSVTNSLNWIGVIGLVLILTVVILYFLRKRILKEKSVVFGSTWGCGYKFANPITNQYTATSFSANFKRIATPIFNDVGNVIGYDLNEIFPKQRSYQTQIKDKFESLVIMPSINSLIIWFKKLAFLQTGKIQDYVLYPLFFIIITILLTILNII
ncbi:MAG: proton-conducting transporter membrane subunit [Lutibacter sp.]|jgi:formate hydrogenlyase subunit 3/multisubunit Na+/H+ antiporter MnhD subunit